MLYENLNYCLNELNCREVKKKQKQKQKTKYGM